MTLSRESFDFVREVLREHSAHDLDADKAYLVETRLQPVARRHGLRSIDELVRRLRSPGNGKLLTEVVESMTINETSFFRDGHPFEVLRQAVIPELLRKRASTRRLNVWCAACSSGQEAYSVAMLLCHYFPALSGWSIRQIASDLSAAMLERARKGRYTDLEVARGLPRDFREAYFLKRDRGWQVRDELRRQVEFLAINLGGPWPSLPRMDLVLLRNVLIYFDVPARKRVLAKVRALLQPDGYLLLGGAETTHNLDDEFDVVTYGQCSFHRPRQPQGA